MIDPVRVELTFCVAGLLGAVVGLKKLKIPKTETPIGKVDLRYRARREYSYLFIRKLVVGDDGQ
jgi:hypothetical protein